MPETQKILLLSCCAPCACAVIKKLHEDGADFAVAFYNPNIHPPLNMPNAVTSKKICAKNGALRLSSSNIIPPTGSRWQNRIKTRPNAANAAQSVLNIASSG